MTIDASFVQRLFDFCSAGQSLLGGWMDVANKQPIIIFSSCSWGGNWSS